MAPESQGSYLQAGDWSLTIGYRHQFSYKHFVGDVEQTYRVQQGAEVMNKINLQDIDVTYQATPRFSFTLTVPVLFASRRSNNSYYTTTASGIGDTTLIGQAWLWNPRSAKRGNINIGFGVQGPSGSVSSIARSTVERISAVLVCSGLANFNTLSLPMRGSTS